MPIEHETVQPWLHGLFAIGIHQQDQDKVRGRNHGSI